MGAPCGARYAHSLRAPDSLFELGLCSSDCVKCFIFPRISNFVNVILILSMSFPTEMGLKH